MKEQETERYITFISRLFNSRAGRAVLIAAILGGSITAVLAEKRAVAEAGANLRPVQYLPEVFKRYNPNPIRCIQVLGHICPSDD